MRRDRLNLSGSQLSACAIVALLILAPQVSRADESGISFWLPGQVSSLPAVPAVPGWSMAAVYYHTSVAASGAVAAAREIQIGRFAPTPGASLDTLGARRSTVGIGWHTASACDRRRTTRLGGSAWMLARNGRSLGPTAL